jgi:hypothetical protein
MFKICGVFKHDTTAISKFITQFIDLSGEMKMGNTPALTPGPYMQPIKQIFKLVHF